MEEAQVKLKVGVSLRGVSWQMFYAAIIVDGVYKRLGYGEVVITSGSEGQHKHDTHADGYAMDFRNRNVPLEARAQLAQECRIALGGDYDFVVEGDHNHLEFDPRVKKETVP